MKNQIFTDVLCMKNTGKPCTGKLYARFDEGGQGGLLSTLPRSPKKQPTAWFSEVFWNNMMKKGHVNELKLGLSLYFKEGFISGIKESIKHQKLGMNMMKAKRMSAGELFGGHAIKDTSGLQKIIQKAQEIVATCAACWLATKEAQERFDDDPELMADANKALAEAGLKFENKKKFVTWSKY